jgi:hypothetical protein
MRDATVATSNAPLPILSEFDDTPSIEQYKELPTRSRQTYRACGIDMAGPTAVKAPLFTRTEFGDVADAFGGVNSRAAELPPFAST